MKVYLATHGSYSDFEVRAVFKREADAEAYELGDSVEEFDLLEGPKEVRTWHRLSWRPDMPEPAYETDGYYSGPGRVPNPHEDPYGVRQDYDGHPNRIEHRWQRWGGQGSGQLEVCGWDVERIRKVFGELRAEWLNCKALGMVWDREKFEWTPGDEQEQG